MINISLFITVFFAKISAQDVFDMKIRINLKQASKAQYLDTIKSRTGYYFLYSTSVNPDEIIKIQPGEYKLRQLLDSIFIDQNITYVLRNKVIVLSPQFQTNQNLTNKNIVIEGKVTGRHKHAIPFATIYFKNRSKGTIANFDGEFRFIIPSEYMNDTLTISSMGYERALIPPEEYLTSKIEAQLKPVSIPIKTVIIRPENPQELVLKSYALRKENNITSPVLLTAFFREASKQNDDYISLTEALIEISKSSYISDSDDLIRLVKGRNGTNIKESELVNLKVEGGLYNGLRLDVAKYGSYFYRDDALDYCNYRMIRTTIYEGRQTYMIGFEMKEGLKIPGYNGTLFIDAETLALVRAEFEVSPEGLRYARAQLIKKTPRGFTAKPLYARYAVEYRYYDSTWNLYYAHNELKIKVRKERGKQNKGFSCNFVSSSEFVVTGKIENPEKRIRYRDAVSSSDVLVEQVKNTSSVFWLENNVILPEEPLQNTITKLQKEGIINKSDTAISKEEK